MRPTNKYFLAWIAFWAIVFGLIGALAFVTPGCASPAQSAAPSVALDLQDRAAIRDLNVKLQTLQQKIDQQIGTVQGNNVSYDLSPEQRKSLADRDRNWACAVGIALGLALFMAGAKGLPAPWNWWSAGLGVALIASCVVILAFVR